MEAFSCSSASLDPVVRYAAAGQSSASRTKGLQRSGSHGACGPCPDPYTGSNAAHPPENGAHIDPNSTKVNYNVQGWWRIPARSCKKIEFARDFVAWGARYEPWNFNPGVDASWPKFPVEDQDFILNRAEHVQASRSAAFIAFDVFPFPDNAGGRTAIIRLFEAGSAFCWE